MGQIVNKINSIGEDNIKNLKDEDFPKKTIQNIKKRLKRGPRP